MLFFILVWFVIVVHFFSDISFMFSVLISWPSFIGLSPWEVILFIYLCSMQEWQSHLGSSVHTYFDRYCKTNHIFGPLMTNQNIWISSFIVMDEFKLHIIRQNSDEFLYVLKLILVSWSQLDLHRTGAPTHFRAWI